MPDTSTPPSSTPAPQPPPAAGSVRISVIECYRQGWRSFSKWWIPISLISGVIFVFNILPRMMVSEDVSEVTENLRLFVSSTADANTVGMEQAWLRIGEQLTYLGFNLLRWTAFAMPFIAVCTALLFIVANFAVKDRKEQQGVAYTLYLAGVNVILAFVRVVPFFLFIVPGIYIYVKLFFVSLVMIESKCGARQAAATSWRMTGGPHFWPLTVLLMMNVGVNAVAGVTVIGLIPSVGFTTTARTAAFHRIWKGSIEETLAAVER